MKNILISFGRLRLKLLGKMADDRISEGGKTYAGAACVTCVSLSE
jgi:hypothetical protein